MYDFTEPGSYLSHSNIFETFFVFSNTCKKTTLLPRFFFYYYFSDTKLLLSSRRTYGTRFFYLGPGSKHHLTQLAVFIGRCFKPRLMTRSRSAHVQPKQTIFWRKSYHSGKSFYRRNFDFTVIATSVFFLRRTSIFILLF